MSIPAERNDFRIPTLNHHGFMFTKVDPIAQKWIDSVESNPNQRLFEVGGAYGNVAKICLEKGISHYVLNDLEPQHLDAFYQNLPDGLRTSSLEMRPGRCPDDISLEESAYDGLLANKVLHFFTPDNIDAFVAWIYRGLKPGGKVYIHTKGVPAASGILEEYEARKAARERFPGYLDNFPETPIGRKYPRETVPQTLLLMELSTLKELFEKHGFTIEETFELAVINENNPEWHEGDDLVGIIAIKS